MRRINYLFLALFATLAFAACSDDDDDPKEEPEKAFCTIDQDPVEDDCKPFCDNPENAEHESCLPDETDCTDPANAEHIDCYELPAEGERTGLCTGQEINLGMIQSELAGIAKDRATGECGALAYIATPPTETEYEELMRCLSVEIAATENVEIDADCSYCVAKEVGCVVAYCAAKCASDAEAPDCMACRDENNCEEGVDECRGLRSAEDCEALPEDASCPVDCEKTEGEGDEEVLVNEDHAFCQAQGE